jgi:hypothetical protein
MDSLLAVCRTRELRDGRADGVPRYGGCDSQVFDRHSPRCVVEGMISQDPHGRLCIKAAADYLLSGWAERVPGNDLTLANRVEVHRGDPYVAADAWQAEVAFIALLALDSLDALDSLITFGALSASVAPVRLDRPSVPGDRRRPAHLLGPPARADQRGAGRP